jgi:hypothetical protein
MSKKLWARDKRGRPIEPTTHTESRAESAAREQAERDARIATAQTALVKPVDATGLEAAACAQLAQSGKTCATCGACVVRVDGYCSSVAVRNSVQNWDGLVMFPQRFGCGYWRSK